MHIITLMPPEKGFSVPFKFSEWLRYFTSKEKKERKSLFLPHRNIMFPTLKSTIDGLCDFPTVGSFYYISESPETSANFLILYHLLEALKDHNVCFISLQNTWSHYCIIGNKFGINLRNKVSEGSIAFMDGNKELLKRITNELNIDNIFSQVTCDMDSLKNIYLFIKMQLEIFKNNDKKCAVIIDSLMPLINMNFSIFDIDTFVQSCHQLVKSDGFLVLSTIVDESDKTLVLFSNLLLRKCSSNLAVKGLSTGISNNVHGKLCVTVFSKKVTERISKRSDFHFKVEDRDVKLYELQS